jgi:hypothetical protein
VPIDLGAASGAGAARDVQAMMQSAVALAASQREDGTKRLAEAAERPKFERDRERESVPARKP